MPPTKRLHNRLRSVAAPLAGLLLAAEPLSARAESSYGMAVGAANSYYAGGELQGSVIKGKEQPGVLPLSLSQAIELGLKNNLGLLLRKEGITSARGQRWLELRKLLPDLTTSAGVHHLQESLAITGITLPGVPQVVGPFNYYDARIFLSQRLFDLEAIKRTESADYEVAAAELSEKDARELVVVAVGSAYLQALAGIARVETVSAEVVTADTILERAVAMHKSGIIPGIDELRARVESLSRTQQLIVAQNDLAKAKLSLLRLIGLPVGQQIELSDRSPFEPLPGGDPAGLLSRALGSREDYLAAHNLVKAAEASRQAAHAQRLPTLELAADFGKTGISLSSLQDTYHIVGLIRVPIFQGGKVHGDVLRADALLRQRQDELDDLRGRIEFELRTALLDVEAAARELEVAAKSVELAELALSQAEERFTTGISDNLEVVQAQQALTAAHEALVSSRYQHNLAKLMLAKAVGAAAASGTGGK